MLDTMTCAMAFRILRLNGYNVSSGNFSRLDFFSTFNRWILTFDPYWTHLSTWKHGADELYHVVEASGLHNSLGGYLNDTRTLLELHKASTVSISEDESILDSIGSRSRTLLREQLESGGALRKPSLFKEVYFSGCAVLITFRIWKDWIYIKR
jgi:acyclic sesquiterpene synthase